MISIDDILQARPRVQPFVRRTSLERSRTLSDELGTNVYLKLELFQKSNPNIRFQAIAFDKGDYVNFFQRKTPMDIIFKIQENEFKGGTTIQLVIEDLRVSQ